MGTKRARRAYTAEYKAEVVKLYQSMEKSIPELARELELPASAVRRWVAEAEASEQGGGTGLTADERTELLSLRREVRVLREERDILKRATAFFARETR